MTRVGTCHYRSTGEAKASYNNHFEDALKEGAIKIGKPDFDAKKRKLIVDGDGRYWLEDLKGEKLWDLRGAINAEQVQK
jgi:hypothetical protein